jgi:hypothetical protein
MMLNIPTPSSPSLWLELGLSVEELPNELEECRRAQF